MVPAAGDARHLSPERAPERHGPLPPLVVPVRPPPSIGKRFREALSLAIWVITAVTRVGSRRVGQWLTSTKGRASAVRSSAREASTAEGGPAHPAPPRRRRRIRRPAWVLAGLTTVLAVMTIAPGPVLQLAAKPLAHGIGAKGLPPLEVASTIVAADGSRVSDVHDGINRRLITLEDVPDVVRQAVIAAEDRSFWSHAGYDGTAMGRALIANLRAGEVTQGGSTITQQVAKQNFVGNRQSVLRKAKELLYAVALEARLSKEEILERYLNQVYFGSQAYGVAAAAEEFFGVEPTELSPGQAALLAGLIRAPAALDPRTNPAAATSRRNQVIEAMVSTGAISSDAAAAAAAPPIEVLPARSQAVADPFVVEAVKREFLANPAFGRTEDDRRRLLLTAGLEIRTTVDRRAQEAARAALEKAPADLGSALVAVDPRSGAILAIHDAGTAAASQFDVATQGRREPGSTFKPVAAAAALEAGMPQTQFLVGDGPIQISYRGGPEAWVVDNFEGSQHGPVVLADAVINSVNTAFAQLGVAIGPEPIADMAGRLGIDVDRAMGPPAERGPAVALGGLEHGVSPLELASAYATFAAGGTHNRPYLIEQVLAGDGRELYRAKPAPQRVLGEAANGILVEMLQDAVREGTGSAAALPGWEPLGKTGTSEEGADAWFVGATPVMAAAVWIGHPQSTEPVPGLTGGRVAAPVWAEFMTAALAGAEPVTFPPRSADRPDTQPLDLPIVHACTEECAA